MLRHICMSAVIYGQHAWTAEDKNTDSGSWIISGAVALGSSNDRKGFKKRNLPPAFVQVADSFFVSIVLVFCSYLASAPPNSGYVLPGHAFGLIGLSPPRGTHGGALSDASIVSASACHRLRFGCAETSKSWIRLDRPDGSLMWLAGYPTTEGM